MVSVLTLDKKGLLSAVLLGLLLLLLGRSEGPLFFFSMLFFLIAGAAVTRIKASRKKVLGVHDPDRGWRNVWANGAVPFFVAVLYFISSFVDQRAGTAITVAYIAVVAAITADKFSSELGVLDKKTYMLLTAQRIRPGTSGGVSVLGLVFGLLAAVLVAGVFGLTYFGSVAVFVLIAAAGFAGDLVDSVFGYFEDKGTGNKFTTNVACGASAAVVALVVYSWLYLYLI
ncbi:MAG: DUF92 domain-containing protein [Candidatus Marsarchaeota archaeon]|jgi:uncharacterized protein (TIGR00297 family)|nr:DUF92 domain-containing protein [Candidatus Marsarchaeota archaeon]